DDDLKDDDDKDEFFDAIEANTIPNLVVPAQSIRCIYLLCHFYSCLISFPSYSPYAYLRASLPIRAKRPATSPWFALENSIGKDLTKISFPVYFNEPTNMLLRMAMDLEFSECLDIASSTPSPRLRIAYIAAFAMSNIAAKPFDPILGETFEYVC
ncbi:hypothetical protein EV359DRAFT_44051, partial [Lentinula novae-zelandiae]